MGSSLDARPGMGARLLCAALVGLLTAGFVYAHWRTVLPHELAPDFDHLWSAARALRDGQNPYPLVGRGRVIDWPWPLYYPLPAVLLAVPFTLLPVEVARAAFMGIGSALLAFAVTQRGWHSLLLLGSMAYYHAVVRVQWAPFLVAAVLLPWLAGIYAAKPTIGAALWAARPSRAAVIGVATLLLVSFLVVPSWPLDWLAAVRTSSHLRAPITLTGGFLVLFALARWRRWEARLLVGLACVPQTTVHYETLPLFLVPRTLIQTGVLVIGSHAAWHVTRLLGPYDSLPELWLSAGRNLVLLMYLPALVMVLRRPNEGCLPSWLARVVSRGS